MSSYTDPTIADFKAYFFRDFPYGTTIEEIQDQDITRALNDAGFNFNPAFFPTQAKYSTGYLLLSAHFLVSNLQASSQGIAGQYSFLQNSKGVGSVNEAFNIPQRILDHPELSMLAKTRYGAQYLLFIMPYLVAPISLAYGRTLP